MCHIGRARRLTISSPLRQTSSYPFNAGRRSGQLTVGGSDSDADSGMEIQQLLLSRDYLHRAAVQAGPYAAGCLDKRTAASVDAARVLPVDRTRSYSPVGLDCHRSSLHDVLLRHRQRQHSGNAVAMMQYPAAQHPLPAAAAAISAMGLGTSGSSPYCGPYYQRSSSSSHHYLPPTHVFPDTSRHNIDSFAATTMQPSFSYQQQAALLRDTASRLAAVDCVQPELASPRTDTTPRLGVELPSHCTDRRCGPTAPFYDCLPVPGGLNLPSSRYYMPAAPRHTSGGSHSAGGGSAGAFMRYLRPPVNVNTDSYSPSDCVCHWIDPASISSQHAKIKVSIFL